MRTNKKILFDGKMLDLEELAMVDENFFCKEYTRNYSGHTFKGRRVRTGARVYYGGRACLVSRSKRTVFTWRENQRNDIKLWLCHYRDYGTDYEKISSVDGFGIVLYRYKTEFDMMAGLRVFILTGKDRGKIKSFKC